MDLTVTVALSGVCVEGCTADKAEEEEDALAMFPSANTETALMILLHKKATALCTRSENLCSEACFAMLAPSVFCMDWLLLW